MEYTLSQAAAQVNVSPSTIKYWLDRQYLPFTVRRKGLGRYRMFTPEQIEELRAYIQRYY